MKSPKSHAEIARTRAGLYAIAYLMHTTPHPDGKYCTVILLVNDQVKPSSTTIVDACLTAEELMDCLENPGGVALMPH